jgi:hypothetical protein
MRIQSLLFAAVALLAAPVTMQAQLGDRREVARDARGMRQLRADSAVKP